MSRKRWKTMIWPTGQFQTWPSQKQAYEYVGRQREGKALGHLRTDSVTVYVSEDGGPWQTYERVRFSA